MTIKDKVEALMESIVHKEVSEDGRLLEVTIERFDGTTITFYRDGTCSDTNIIKDRETTGYQVVSFPIKGVGSIFMDLHTLYGYIFLGNDRRERLVVNHKNMRPWDNNVDNLELISISCNVKHGAMYRYAVLKDLIEDGEKLTGKFMGKLLIGIKWQETNAFERMRLVKISKEAV